jgi:hypothetical protein
MTVLAEHPTAIHSEADAVVLAPAVLTGLGDHLGQRNHIDAVEVCGQRDRLAAHYRPP